MSRQTQNEAGAMAGTRTKCAACASAVSRRTWWSADRVQAKPQSSWRWAWPVSRPPSAARSVVRLAPSNGAAPQKPSQDRPETRKKTLTRRTAIRQYPAMLGEPKNQLTLTRTALSTCGTQKVNSAEPTGLRRSRAQRAVLMLTIWPTLRLDRHCIFLKGPAHRNRIKLATRWLPGTRILL
jgi:hypothetical protein